MNSTTRVQIVPEIIKPMAEIIPEQVLDAALKEIVNFSDVEARGEIDRISLVQPALVEYFIAMTEDSADVQNFAAAMFIAIHKVFEQQFGPLHKVGTKRVEQIADHNEQAMIYLRIRQPEEEGFVSAGLAVGQPRLLAYVFGLIRTPKGNEPELSEIEQDGLAVIMKTVIDVLDSAVDVKR
jgi:hypothetical protein